MISENIDYFDGKELAKSKKDIDLFLQRAPERITFSVWKQKYKKEGEQFRDWLDRITDSIPKVFFEQETARKTILIHMFFDDGASNWLNGFDLSYDIWHNKYREHSSDLEKWESFDEWLNRVSNGYEPIKQMILKKKFLFGGRTLANRGTTNGSYSNCYSIGYVPDSLDGIFDVNSKIAMTFKAQGGQGLSLSKIRPKGSLIAGRFQSDGIVPFMEVFNTTTSSVSQGGSRKGALLMSLDINHPEAEAFMTIKSDLKKINKANLSLEIDNGFMNKVIGDIGEGIESEEVRKFNLLSEQACKYAEPGVILTDKFRNYNIMQYVDEYQIETCNPCFTGDTMVAVADGRNAVSIKQLADENTNFPVYSARKRKRGDNSKDLLKNWMPEIKNAIAFKTGTKDVIEVILSDGSSFKCTPEHRLALSDGTYIEAKDSIGLELAKFLHIVQMIIYTNIDTSIHFLHIDNMQ